VNLRLGTTATSWESSCGDIAAVHTADGERLTADASSSPPSHRSERGPSQLVIHLATPVRYGAIAAHNLHFGSDRRRNAQEVLLRGELMRDPTVLVTVAEGAYRVVVPVPNLRLAPLDWDGPAGRAYAGEIIATLEARGYADLGAGLRASYVVTPADWARQGMCYGIPHASTKRPSTLHSALANVVIAGTGIDAGRRAAERVIAI
jgi:phytoene desaturase